MEGMADVTRHAGRWTLEDRFASPWHYLPVEMPPGTAGLRVELEYERHGGTVIDLGCLGSRGFRGWSGGAREWFAITAEAATPGYLPGELEAGTWQVMIGLYKIPPGGVGYRLTAQATPFAADLVPAAPPPPPGGTCRPVRAGAGWPVTCTRIPCTPTAGSRLASSRHWRPAAAWTSSR
jgi:hypothetical protein